MSSLTLVSLLWFKRTHIVNVGCLHKQSNLFVCFFLSRNSQHLQCGTQRLHSEDGLLSAEHKLTCNHERAWLRKDPLSWVGALYIIPYDHRACFKESINSDASHVVIRFHFLFSSKTVRIMLDFLTLICRINSSNNDSKSSFLDATLWHRWMKVQFIQKYQDVPTHYVDELEDL